MSSVALNNKAISSVGGEEEFTKKLNQYTDSVSYIDKNRKEILGKYNGRWIVVYNSEILDNAKTYDEIITKTEKRDIPIIEAVIKFIDGKKVMTLF